MFPPSNTVARWVADEDGDSATFDLWEANFANAIGHARGLKAVEVFVELGGGGGAALYIFDGKNYWSPVYEELADQNQFERETGHAAGVHRAWDDYEFDPDEWAWHVHDHYDSLDYEDIGTRIPLVY